MNRIIYLLIIFLAGFSCETDLDINTKIPSIPLVYSVIKTSDSVHYVRLSRTFQTNYGIFEYGIPGDSLIYPEAIISIERWFDGKFVQREFFKPIPEAARDSGLFPVSPYQLYGLKRSAANSGFFGQIALEEMRLLVDIPGKPVVYSELFMVMPVMMATPRNDGRTYNMFDFKVIFKAYSNYTELYVRLHYLNRYADTTTSEMVSWREFHDHDIVDRDIGKDFEIPLEGIPLYERIGNNIPEDTAVFTRQFEYAEIIINCLDENVYRYNESQRTIPSDQAGRPFTNVVNGMGIVGSRYNRTISILFDHRSMVELCNGEYTKHLNFIDW